MRPNMLAISTEIHFQTSCKKAIKLGPKCKPSVLWSNQAQLDSLIYGFYCKAELILNNLKTKKRLPEGGLEPSTFGLWSRCHTYYCRDPCLEQNTTLPVIDLEDIFFLTCTKYKYDSITKLFLCT